MPETRRGQCARESIANRQQSGGTIEGKTEKGRGREGERRRIVCRDHRKKIGEPDPVSSYSHTVGSAIWRDLPKSFRYSSRLSRSSHLDGDSDPGGSLLEAARRFSRLSLLLLLKLSAPYFEQLCTHAAENGKSHEIYFADKLTYLAVIHFWQGYCAKLKRFYISLYLFHIRAPPRCI